MSLRKLCFLLPLPVPEDTDFLKVTQLVQFLLTEEGLTLFHREEYFRKFSVDKYPLENCSCMHTPEDNFAFNLPFLHFLFLYEV